MGGRRRAPRVDGGRAGRPRERGHREEDLDRLLDTRPALPFAITVADFVATRVTELVVHADDLAASIGVEYTPPPKRPT